VLALPSVEITAFFPQALGDFHPVGDTAFVDRAGAWRVDLDEAVFPTRLDSAVSVARLPQYGRLAACLAVALTGIAWVLVAAATVLQTLTWLDVLLSLVTAGAMIVLFHAAAAETLSSLWAPLPAGLLTLWSLQRYLALRWTRGPSGPRML
jgi:hypothetical protein